MLTSWRRRPALLVTMSLTIAVAGVLAVSRAGPAAAVTGPGWRIVSATNFRGSAPGGSGYGAVVAPSATDAWAFGGTDQGSDHGTPVAEHWNGKTWSRSALPSGLHGWISAASAPSASDIWALSSLNGYVLHWNGSSWSVAKRWTQTSPYSSAFTGITAFSATNVWVFGGVVNGLTPLVGFGTWHYNGKTWTKVTGQGRNVVQASAVSASDMWGIGGYLTAYNQVDRYNGHKWQAVSVPSYMTDYERYVLAQSASSVWVDGENTSTATGQPELMHWNGKGWAHVSTDAPAGSLLDAIASDGQGGINILANSTDSTQCWVLHRSSSGTWTRTELTKDAEIDGLVQIPRTKSSWSAGTLFGADTKAVIWADGALP
jgi:hypothetical protein